MPNLETWNQYVEGMKIEWPFSFSMENNLTYAKLSGDYNPVHLDADFAKSKGFDSPLIYGGLLTSQISRLIGQELPDKNTIEIGVQIDFMQPSFPGEKLIFKANLITKSDATYFLEFKCHISRDEETLCRGTAKAIWRP